jgi:hypothetical protein
MNKMNTFKKTLIAGALVGISGTASAALTFAPDGTAATTVTAPSIDAIATAEDHVGPAAIWTTAANYGTGDTISLTSNIAVSANQSWSTAALTATACDGAGSMQVSFAGYDASTKVATYTVGAAGATTVDCVVAFPAITYDGATLAAADKASLSLSTSRGFGVLESVAAVDMVDVGATQFTVAVTAAADETIDVNANRNSFVGYVAASGDDATDVITLTTASAAGAATYNDLATITEISGDFSWAKTVDAVTGAVSYPAIVVSGTGSVAADGGVTDSTITFVHAEGAATVTFTPPVAADDLRTLPATTYTAVTTVAFTDADGEDQTKVISSAAGDWDLNGASITALGVSNSPSVTPMIWIQNSGSSNGAITGSVNCNGSTITIADLGTAAPLANTKVGDAIQAAVDADGSCPTSNTRYDATVTVNGPAADITMNASYKVTAADGATDRVMLETSDSLPAASN